jgi:hypothetical protein
MFKKAIRYLRESFRSTYTGTWEDEIFENDTRTTVIKRDSFQLKHNKKDNTIYGTIKRIEPKNQDYREWNCTGVIDQGYLILSFWSKDSNTKSNGCIYVHHIDDYVYEGYYLEEHRQGKIDVTPINLYKVRNVRIAGSSQSEKSS